MRIAFKKIIVLLLMACAPVATAEPPSAQLSKMLPNKIGEFHQVPSMRPLVMLGKEGLINPSTFRVMADPGKSPFVGGEVDYVSAGGEKLTIEILRLRGESDAYSLLSLVAYKMRETEPAEISLGGVGTASVISSRQVALCKGSTFLRVTDANPNPSSSAAALTLARLFADQLDGGEGEIPVLVKHLPGWENAQPRVLYAVNQNTLKTEFSNQSVFEAVSFEGGAEAVVGNYAPQQLAIIEFNTASLATDNDQRITAKIHELQTQGQPVPSAYRRVGNYSVFVLDAPSQETANRLIDQVKYQQVVQWLGDDPYLYERATREFTETTLGVFVAVVKASGLALVTCFAIGGLFGAILFSRRRAQQRTVEAYSDAGGMVRLNLDEMTPRSDPTRLLGRGNQARH
ncbi:MAG: hypothetical protein M3Y84_11100 [Acidobacteriota bacterium]|nr:hypothetical protein [Acidobacteriota bacterium]